MSTLSLIPALPLFGFLINGLFGARLPKALVSLIACGLPALAFVCTLGAFQQLGAGPALSETLFTWASLPGFSVDIALYFDRITAIMCLVVTGIGTLIHIYSTGYMAEDRSYARYFAYLNLFLFFMLLLVLGKNLLVLFIGWEGVGLASYLLIGFWFEDRAKASAGVKAFIVNRVGDVGFVLAAILLYQVVGSFDLQAINAYFEAYDAPAALTASIALLLLLGACGKSAQIPLHVWLPDAMAGPTPVSALIHAATMVTAGVYLLARLNGLYLETPMVMQIVAWLGAATALLGAALAITQFNLKKVLAYSTISQLGFMVMACGLGAFSVALFHLVTHAFFKACLFLSAGAVLHALNGEEDMRRMGGLARTLPVTCATFVIAALALSGAPPLAGFFSKDEILWNAWSQGSPWLWGAAILASTFTAFYIFRAVFLTFFGASRLDASVHPHEAPRSMSSVLVVLACGSIGIGFIGLPSAWRHLIGVDAPFYTYLAPVFASADESHASLAAEWVLMGVAVLAALGGIVVAWRRSARAHMRVASTRGDFFDAVYTQFVRGVDWLSDSALARGVERALFALTLATPTFSARWLSARLAGLQTGNVQAYAFYAVMGLALLFWWGASHG